MAVKYNSCLFAALAVLWRCALWCVDSARVMATPIRSCRNMERKRRSLPFDVHHQPLRFRTKSKKGATLGWKRLVVVVVVVVEASGRCQGRGWSGGEVGWVVTALQPPRHRSASTVSSSVSNVSPRRQGCIATEEMIHVYDAAICTAEWNTLVFSCTRGGFVFKTTFRKLGHSGDRLFTPGTLLADTHREPEHLVVLMEC